MKYESLITDMTNVKIFEKWVKLQGQGHKVKKKLVPIEKFCHKVHTCEI
jgi:hypothetical protein